MNGWWCVYLMNPFGISISTVVSRHRAKRDATDALEAFDEVVK